MVATRPEDMRAWIGPAWDELSTDQRTRFAAAVDDIDARYPDPDDQHVRDAVMSAAVQWMLGEITLAEAGANLRNARAQEEIARGVARQVAVMAARAVGVDRMACVGGWGNELQPSRGAVAAAVAGRPPSTRRSRRCCHQSRHHSVTG